MLGMMRREGQRPAAVSARGFSTIELMIVLSIAVIFLTMAVPSFTRMIGQMRVSMAVNDFLAGIKATRSEALGRGTRVDMAPNLDDKWESGWTVFVDTDADQIHDSDEPVILRREALPSGMIIDGGTTGSAFYDKVAGKKYIAFNAAGYAKKNSDASAMNSMQLRNEYAKRKLSVSFLGRVTICDPNTDKDCK